MFEHIYARKFSKQYVAHFLYCTETWVHKTKCYVLIVQLGHYVYGLVYLFCYDAL